MLDLEARKKGIGGSDVAAICGLSPWKSAYDVWLDKTSPVMLTPPTPAMEYGIMMEPVIRKWYERETGKRIIVPEMIRHPEHPFMLANLDGVAEDRVLEIKTARSSQDWGEPGTDEIPDYYRTQVEHYMMVTGKTLADVVVSFAGSVPMIYSVEADPELQLILLENERSFWDLVESMTAPEPVTYSDMIKAYPKSSGKAIIASSDLDIWIRTLRTLKSKLKAFEEAEEEIKTQIMSVMGDAESIVSLSGKTLLTWKTSKTPSRFDLEKFKEESPEIYEKFLYAGKPQRRFIVKKEQ